MGIYRKNSILVVRGIVAAFLVVLIDYLFGRISISLFYPLTTYNHAASEAYAWNMLIMGLGERPSIIGYLYMDRVR